jgi:hypothetical protein
MYPFTVENKEVNEVNHVGITLQVFYPETYPDVAPEINVFNLKNLNNQLCNELKERLESLAQDYIGSQMIYNLTTAAQEWLLERNDERMKEKTQDHAEQEVNLMSAYERMMLEKQREQQELQKLNRYTLDANLGKGTPVTIENFREWKKRFDEERKQVQELLRQQQQQLQQQQGNKDLIDNDRLTGRQWFEQKSKWFNADIVGGEEEEEDVEIDEDLFLENEEEEEQNAQGYR